MHKKFTEIPELVALVSGNLTIQDLFTCVQVSSQWHELFVPALWHTIDDTTRSWSHILYQCGDPGTLFCDPNLYSGLIDADKNKDREWLMSVFRKYGCHIRELTIHWPMVLEAASMTLLGKTGTGGSGCLALQSLTLEIKTPYQPQPVPEGGVFEHDPNFPSPPPTAMPPLVMPAPLFPGVVEETDFVQPQHFGLTLEAQKEALETGWEWTQHYWNLILSNHGLTRLVLGPATGYISLLWSVESKEVFLRNVAKLPCLKELQGWIIVTLSSVWELLAAVPTLEFLTTTCSEDKLPDPLPEVNTTLRTLTVHGSLSINNLLDVLSLLPNLSSLTLTKIGVRAVQQQPPELGFEFGMASSFLPEHVCPRDHSVGANLRELNVDSVGDYDTLLKHLPDHIELTWNEPISTYNSVPLQLPEHSTRFSVFKAPFPPWYIDEEFEPRAPHDFVANELLTTSSRLRVFDSIRHFILVDEMLRRPWLCMGLEWLTCRILGVNRLTDEEQSLAERVMVPGYSSDLSAEEAAAVEKFERCRAQHHGVYDHLARLTRLRHLDLGYENRYPWTCKIGDVYEVDGVEYLEYTTPPTFETLELSLASGLDRLGALKDLEMIGFERLNHRIRRPELEWMAKSWPRLNLMYGLDKERLMDIEHCKERTALREYFQQLRPSVIHDSLFYDDV
ncbi:hypothetical protein BG003_011616 [Podila horticola]|nr:hypothetical protein BG003_011616 [Podila horticola]